MSWSKNNNAHKTLWAMVSYFHKDSLQGQPFVTFVEGGEWQLKRVIKASGNDSPQMILGKAGSMAAKLDEFFHGVFKTQYEKISDTIDENSARAAAISAMTQALSKIDEKLNTVGDVVDEHYLFKGEIL